MLTARLRRLRGNDAGMTLTELIVGMTLMLIVATSATTYFVSQSNQSTRTINASFTTATARTALTSIATDLRLADTPTAEPGYSTGRFVTAKATQVVFYSNITANRSGTQERTPPTKIDIHVVTGTKHLIEQDYAPLHAYTTYPQNYDTTYTSNYPSLPTSSELLVSNLKNTTSVFSYCMSVDGSCSSSPTDLAGIASVAVTLNVPDITGDHPQSLQTSVAITGAFS